MPGMSPTLHKGDGCLRAPMRPNETKMSDDHRERARTEAKGL